MHVTLTDAIAASERFLDYLPRRATRGAAGLDLRAALIRPVVLWPLTRRVIPTGVRVALGGYAGLVCPRSGLAAKRGLTVLNGPGLIDPDYRGEVKVVLYNSGLVPRLIRPRDRIAQLLVVPYETTEPQRVSALPDTSRGAGGLGSTGER